MGGYTPETTGPRAEGQASGSGPAWGDSLAFLGDAFCLVLFTVNLLPLWSVKPDPSFHEADGSLGVGGAGGVRLPGDWGVRGMTWGGKAAHAGCTLGTGTRRAFA